MYDRKGLFDMMLRRVADVAAERGLEPSQAFGRWFAEMYLSQARDIFVSDGSGDGRVDLFCTTHDGEDVRHYVVNAKFTKTYDKMAPRSFYDEMVAFDQAFKNPRRRGDFLNSVRSELRQRYRLLLERHDDGDAELIFLTNHARNVRQHRAIRSDVTAFHLEDLLQFMVDHIEEAMPKTSPLRLSGINSVLTPETRDAKVPTSIVFARVIDFIEYMRKDPFDLLFARNVRLNLGGTQVNQEIRKTFERAPEEFVFSNNGLTMLCEKHGYDPGRKQVTVENPRIVNGSQTLHWIRDVDDPSREARIMVRVIEVAPLGVDDLAAGAQRRRELIRKIATRTNRQNPIKKWNLVAGDDFQASLARYFRLHNLFYERRAREWRDRKTELGGVGIRRGPKITQLAQLIASYHWEKSWDRSGDELGPVTAKRTVDGLFDGRRYDVLVRTPPPLALELHRLNEKVLSVFSELAGQRGYIARMRRHADLALFALVVRVLQTSGVRLGSGHIEDLVKPTREWTRLILACSAHINAAYKKQAAKARKDAGRDLPLNNFFKSPSYANAWLKGALPRDLALLGRRLKVAASK